MWKVATLSLGALALAAVTPRVAETAAPVPPTPPGPSIEGKYTILLSSIGGGKGGGGFGGPGGRGVPAGFGERVSAAARRETTISRHTIAIEGMAATWEYRLDPTAKPTAIDLIITPIRGKKSTHRGIFEIKGDRLTIAFTQEGEDRPKDFEDAEGVRVYVFQKQPPPPRAEYRIVVLHVGKGAEAEKAINQLAKDGFEVAFTTNPATLQGLLGVPQDPVIHLVMKRMVK